MYVVRCKPYENTCMRLISKTQRILAIKYTAYQLNKMQLYNTVSTMLPSIFPSITWFRRQFLRNMSPNQLAFLLFYCTGWHKKTGTFEMRSGSHVQLAALRNRDVELQTTSPFSNHRSVERSAACFRHKNVLVLLGFQKFPFFVSPCI